MRAFLFLFLLFPIIELALLIQVGSAIGVLPTLLLVIGTAILGSILLRVAGVATAWRAREKLARGELPEQEMLEGLLIAVGGGVFSNITVRAQATKTPIYRDVAPDVFWGTSKLIALIDGSLAAALRPAATDEFTATPPTSSWSAGADSFEIPQRGNH